MGLRSPPRADPDILGQHEPFKCSGFNQISHFSARCSF